LSRAGKGISPKSPPRAHTLFPCSRFKVQGSTVQCSSFTSPAFSIQPLAFSLFPITFLPPSSAKFDQIKARKKISRTSAFGL
jgi:hypothetical protein